jgi:methylenetetrahydrofolate--tRNA-(uracil-5-)-methyltransferase
MSGLLAGWNAVRILGGEQPELPPRETMIGGLYAYLREADPERFQPMNANFGLVPPAEHGIRGKQGRRAAQSARALAAIEAWAEAREPGAARVATP